MSELHHKIKWTGMALMCFMAGVAMAQPALTTTSKRAIELYNNADNYRVRGNFGHAIELLKMAIDKEKNFEEAYFRLGVCYRSNGDMPHSTETFEKGFLLIKDLRRQNLYRYELGENYLRVGNYPKALEAVNQFLATEKDHLVKIDIVKVWQAQVQYALEHQSEKLDYHPVPLSDTVNRFPMQYFPVLTADNRQLLFTIRQGRGYNDDEDIYISLKDDQGRWQEPVSLSPNINSDQRQGASTISADGRLMIFTACGVRNTNGSCDLFESRKIGDTWTVPVNLGPLVNSSAWDVQPSLSADGQELYFVSTRKGGVGGSDIWYARKDSLGKWMHAQNLGPTINTKYDENSPFIHVNNRNLYFASNAHPGFGGLDIFVSEKVNKEWTTPKNMGAPLNNFEDQYSFFVTADGDRAYYSKDESGKINNTRLYTTPLPKEVQVQYYSNVVKGKVTDSKTGQPLQATVELFDIRNNERMSIVQSDSINGEYIITLTQGAEYALYSTSPGYLFKSLSFNYTVAKHQKPVEVDIQLDLIQKNATAVLNNIFFETDKYDLKEKSRTELLEVIRFLRENPTIKVEIGGHTDNVGAAAYNIQLSLKRAQSVAQYLTGQGIEATRILQKGYGSQQPVKPNTSEENRQVNRRIEFKILE